MIEIFEFILLTYFEVGMFRVDCDAHEESRAEDATLVYPVFSKFRLYLGVHPG